MTAIDRDMIGTLAAGIPELALLCEQNSIVLPAEEDGFVNVYYIMTFWAQCLMNAWSVGGPRFTELANMTEEVATNGTQAVRDAMIELASEIAERGPSMHDMVSSLGANTQKLVTTQYGDSGLEK